MNHNKIPENSTVTVTAIKAFTDNYIWSIGSKTSQEIALVDPGDAKVCIEYIEKNQLKLTTLLITHHHSDHVGGINELTDFCQQKNWPLAIYGPANEQIPHCRHKIKQDDIVSLRHPEISFTVLDVPGHTSGHIAYVSDNRLFCGDTLFSGGCGRLFEGTPAQMLTSLQKLAALPDETLVYCTHEYTAANLDFALTIDPKNSALTAYMEQVKTLRAQDKSTLPSSIARENMINPFLRCHKADLQENILTSVDNIQDLTLQTFTKVRQAKDNF